MSALNEASNEKDDMILEGEKYNDLISDMNLTFKKAIMSTYNSFCVLGELLVSSCKIK